MITPFASPSSPALTHTPADPEPVSEPVGEPVAELTASPASPAGFAALWPVVVAVCLVASAIGAAALAYFVFVAPAALGTVQAAAKQKGEGAAALLAFSGIGGAIAAFWVTAKKNENERRDAADQLLRLRRDSERAKAEQVRLRELHNTQKRDHDLLNEAHRALTRQSKQQSLSMEAQRTLLEIAIQSANDVIMITDADLTSGPRVLRVNDAFAAMTGYEQGDILGNSPTFLQGPQTDAKTRSYLRERISNGLSAQAEILNYKKNGTPFWVELNIQPVHDASGHQTHWVSIQRDITERKKSADLILWQANHDSLTGLPNRKLCQEKLADLLDEAVAERKKVGVIFLDVDRFKNVNDTLGHPIGDALLQQVAQRLSAKIACANQENGPVVSRFGGDEFVLLFPAVKEEIEVSKMAQKILQILAPAFTLDGHDLFITASIGVSFAPLDGRDTATLLKNADTALYRAKDEGRDTFRIYEADMNAQSLNKLHHETHLRRALLKNEFHILYQPQVESVSGKLYGVEALMRWENPTLGRVSPAQFIPLAEETGLIGPMGKWVLEQACEVGAQWYRNGRSIKMSVNVSARQFEQDLVTQVRDALQTSGLPPHLLDLEITEGVLVRAENVLDVLHELKALGVRVSVDDFGTGYTNFSYLKTFPIDAVKVDRSIITGIGTDKRSDGMARALISMAHEIGWGVVAEGVEDDAQRAVLCAMGCPSIQGYLFSPPVPEAKIAGLWDAWAGEGDVIPITDEAAPCEKPKRTPRSRTPKAGAAKSDTVDSPSA